MSCVLLADRHHGLSEGVRGLLETAFGTVVMVADETSLIEGAGPDLKVIVLSVHDEQSVRRAAMEAGADAFVLKRAISTDLLLAVDAVRRGPNVEVPAG